MRGVRCEDCQLRRQPQFRPQSPPEFAYIAMSKSRHIRLPANAAIYEPQQAGVPLFTLYSGWAFRYTRFGDGARQIVEFLLPGDLIGLPALFLSRMVYGAETLTRAELCEHAGQPAETLFAEHPGLAQALVRVLIEDRKRADLRLAVLGQRQGPHRIAYLMLELFDRLRRLGLTSGNRCEMPLRRRHWADAAGMSGTHVARSLDWLHAQGLADLRDGELTVLDRDGMTALAGYIQVVGGSPRLLL